MKAGLYKVEKIDGDVTVVQSIQAKHERFTFPVDEFSHEVVEGDIVEIWQESGKWQTMYKEEKTKTANSHIKDFIKRISNQQ
ncbi:hypothetical protein [Planococcus lenghuensis]|uniref:DUF3006 domain-containing protein n=1 Tax=Planococcus lenghuensis TaxID=2213202 RepID=A0A1Q2KU46_9BACL|nr:hypothetical protein [Planococcus lenghuensis]AQQ51735.1 hypothetical protein B0X71_00420 [Planococcus lenghuensis]